MERRKQRYWTDTELDDMAIRLIGHDTLDLESLMDLLISESNLQLLPVHMAVERVANIDEDRKVTLKPEILKKLESPKKPSKA